MRITLRALVDWLAIIGLAGSVLGLLEGLWHLWQAPPISATEAVLVLAWGMVAYAAPVLLLGGAWIGIARVRNRTAWEVPTIPAALVPLGFWVVLLADSYLHPGGPQPLYVIELPAAAALAVGLCLFLRKRWLARLDSIQIWLLLQGLTLSAAALWLAGKYAAGGQMLLIVLGAAGAGACCLWGLVHPSAQGRTLLGAGGFAVAVLTLLTVSPAGHSETTAGVGKQPNVLLITIDTLRADHLGSYGYTKGRTPTIDGMAADAVVFKEAYSQSPITCPSHLSILTGVDPLRHGVLSNQGGALRTDNPTLPELLSSHGYQTAAFVSGYTLKNTACPLGNRFQTYEDDFSPWPWLPQLATKIRSIRMAEPMSKRFGLDLGRIERPAAETTDAALSWLEWAHERAFFLWVHYFDPHIPYAPPPPYDKLFDPGYAGPVDGRWYELSSEAKERIISSQADLQHMIARYDGEIAYVDAQIARLRDAFTRLGLDRNTLVILTSDHGETHGEHNRYFGRDLHRPSLHVPLFFHFPQEEVRARRVSDQVRLIDITPTVLAYLDIDAGPIFEGKSLLYLIRGERSEDDRPAFALLPHGASPEDMFALQHGSHKLIWYSSWWYGQLWMPPREELYNVEVDPQERGNALEREPAVLPDLRQRLMRWREQEVPDHPEVTGEVRDILRSLGYVR